MSKDPQKVYSKKIEEALLRIEYCERLLVENNLLATDSLILQLRKSLEAIAFASIAPNEKEYKKFRENGCKQSNYRKDYNARAIVNHLKQINPHFYPKAMHPSKKISDNSWKLIYKKNGYLTLEEFQKLYDRLGKYLHSDNPWGNDKNIQNLIKEIPNIINKIRGLLMLHESAIIMPDHVESWVVEIQENKVISLAVIRYEKKICS